MLLLAALAMFAAAPAPAAADVAPDCFTPAQKRVDNDAYAWVWLSCGDGDGDDLTYAIVDQPAHGTLSDPSGAGTRTYTPAAHYVGADSFTYRASDGSHESNLVTVSYDVTDPSPPVCTDPAARSLRPGTTAGFTLGFKQPGEPGHCADSPGKADALYQLRFKITQQPAHGTLDLQSLQYGSVGYKPADGYTGPDSFKYVAFNGGGDSNELTQQLDVDASFNRAPSCSADGEPPVMRAGTSKILPVVCLDQDHDPLTITYDRSGLRGTVEEGVEPDFLHQPGSIWVRYTAPADAGDGSDSFSYTATDDRGASSGVATQEITVHPADYDDPPVCQTQWAGYSGSVATGNSAPLYPDCVDPDGDPITLAVTTPPEHGSVKVVTNTFNGVSSSSFVYKAPAGYLGDDTFTYTASDDHGQTSAPITGVVHVVEPPPPYCATGSDLQMRTNGHHSVQLFCFSSVPGTPVNAEPVTYTITQQPAHGTLDFSGGASSGRGVYTPDHDFQGADSFKFKATNSGGDSAIQTVAIDVAPGYNQAPYCYGDFGIYEPPEVRGDGSRVLPVVCIDPDEDPLEVTFAKPAHGTVSGFEPPPAGQPYGAGKITYTPDPGYRGLDSFTFRASDGLAESADGIQRVKVVEPTSNHAPSCVNGWSTRVAANSAHTFNAYELPCWDFDGDELTYTVVTPPQHGQLTGPDSHGAFTYEPSNATYTGEDSFTLAASDGRAAPVNGTIDVDITPAASLTAQAPPLPSGGPVTLQNYVDGDGRSLVEVPRAQVDQFPNDCMPLDVDTTISPGSGGGSVSDVELVLVRSDADPGRRFAMAHGDGDHWSAHIDCVAAGELSVEWTLTEGGTAQSLSKPLGGIVLIDPQGVVYDKAVYDGAIAHGKTPDQARAAAALEGATVVLQRKNGADWGNVSSGDPGIAPNVNPQVTHADGVFRWDVSAGTYRVVVSRPGYDGVTSAAVNIPPAVTNLHVAMTPAAGGGGDGGDGGGDGQPPAGGPGPGSDQPSPGTNPPRTNPPPPKKKPCAGLKGKKRTQCESKQRLKRALAKCSKLKGKKKRATCAKRARAVAKCDRLSGRKKTTCVRRANAIGKARRRR